MARYANTGEFNILYPTRRKMATILKRIIRNEVVDSEGTLVESVRINAKVTGFNNGVPQTANAYGPNGGSIAPRDFVAQFTDAMMEAGLIAEIYRQYTEWITKKYPLVQAVEVLEKQYKLVYTFEALDPPAGFQQGFPLDV